MKNSPKKYPPSLFWSGVAVSILRSFLWLVISTILLLVGRTIPWCAVAGLALLVLVVAVAIVKQLIYRHTLLHASPDMEDWQAATLSPEWKDNVLAMVERAMNDDPELPDDLYEDTVEDTVEDENDDNKSFEGDRSE